MTLLFTLCIVAVVVVGLVSTFGGTGSSSRALEERLERRRAAEAKVVAPVTSIVPEAPVQGVETPVPGEAAA